MLEKLNAHIDEQITKMDDVSVVYYNGERSALLLGDEQIIGVNWDGTITIATGYEWETVTADDEDEDEDGDEESGEQVLGTPQG